VVQGLPWAYTQEQLTPMFQQFGNIVSAEVVYGRDGRSRVSCHGSQQQQMTHESRHMLTACAAAATWHISGHGPVHWCVLGLHLVVSALQGYGTVRFETPEAVQAAIQQLHGSDLEGRTLTVRLDKFA
jgi:RNA recognition motif-containing protein